MADIRLRNSKYLGDFKKPYFVAEVNTSHFGDVNLAKKMIDEAKNAGWIASSFNPGQLKLCTQRHIMTKTQLLKDL